MKTIPRVFFLLALISCIMIILPATAVTITESPEIIDRGDQIFINIQGLQDKSLFSLLIEGQFAINPGQRFTFSTNNFYMPISLKNGQISATTQNTKSGGFSVRKGETTITLAGPADPKTGIFTISKQESVSNGTYDFLKLDITPRSGVSLVDTQMNLMGSKTGPVDSQISFTVEGIDNGLIRLIIYVDNQEVLYKTVTVGSGIPTTTTVPTTTVTTVAQTTTQTTVTTTEPTTETTTQSQTNVTTNATTTGTQATATQTTQLQQYSPTVSGTPGGATYLSPVEVKTFYSADRNVVLTAQGVDYAGLLMMKASGIPENWLSLGNPYTIAPASLSFSPPATISFVIPHSASSGTSYAYFIGKFENNQWTIVPSKVDGDMIEGNIERAAMYGLMAYKPESIIPITTTQKPGKTGTGAETATATETVTPRGTPKIASIAQKTTTPTPSATKTPLSLVVVAGALVISGAVVMLKAKRRQ